MTTRLTTASGENGGKWRFVVSLYPSAPVDGGAGSQQQDGGGASGNVGIGFVVLGQNSCVHPFVYHILLSFSRDPVDVYQPKNVCGFW